MHAEGHAAFGWVATATTMFATNITTQGMVLPPVSHYVMLKYAFDILDGAGLPVCLRKRVILAAISTTVMTYQWLGEGCACSTVIAAVSLQDSLIIM